MIQCIAVDDEKLVLDLLVDNISQVPYLQLVKACKNAIEATSVLQNEKIDLIFLDIQMPRLSGLQFIQTLQQPPMIILITAYEKYALESYNLNVVDYLLKPVSFERFLKACNKAKELFDLKNDKNIQPVEPTHDHIFVNVEYTLVKILYSDILFIEGLKDYIKIHLASSAKPVLTKMTLKAMEEKLPADKFCRIHKSYIVNVDKISVIKRDLVTIGNHEIPVSDFYKENLSRITNK
ncbi:MAG TPA: LytTR family transcriptional regulator DNA-binding domain-containing protein [Hanamia sp.]|jgi:DNA-binding LytR/AlgR family response regulator|nr:LytTR family transcriptional regulator DNA-binding domain-containing protein [Hanamia sp.]